MHVLLYGGVGAYYQRTRARGAGIHESAGSSHRQASVFHYVRQNYSKSLILTEKRASLEFNTGETYYSRQLSKRLFTLFRRVFSFCGSCIRAADPFTPEVRNVVSVGWLPRFSLLFLINSLVRLAQNPSAHLNLARGKSVLGE